MRVRYELFNKGYGTIMAECDLSTKQAQTRYDNLKGNALCGWVELVAEDDCEGGYMETLKKHENTKGAMLLSTII